MKPETRNRSKEQDWRLEAELNVSDVRRGLRDLVGHLRDPQLVKEIESEVPHDVVITHDGSLLFAYAANKTVIDGARRAVGDVLRHDGVNAHMRVSYWNDELDCWRQTDPPPTAQQKQLQDASDRASEAVEMRTLVASSGKLIRAEFEQTMTNWADKLDLRCAVVEHPHLLTTQVAFTVTGPKRKIDEFSEGLKAEELATIRTERQVMLSPL
jgi:hypothetical protein